MTEEKSNTYGADILYSELTPRLLSVLVLVATLLFLRNRRAKRLISESKIKLDLIESLRLNSHRLRLSLHHVEGNSIYEAVRDQLLLHNPKGTYTSDIIRKRADEETRCGYLVGKTPLDDADDKGNKAWRKHVVILQAVAICFNRTIEVIHGDRLESTTIRPMCIHAKNCVQILYIGYGGYDRFFSLRPESVPKSETKDKRTTDTKQDICHQNTMVSDYSTQFNILPTKQDDSENIVTKNIVVGEGNTQNIVATFRSSMELVDFMKNTASESKCNLRLKIRQKSSILTDDELKQKEARIIRILRDKDSDTTKELDEAVKEFGMSFVTATMECILLQLKPTSVEAVKNFIHHFEKGDLENVIKILAHKQFEPTQVPLYVDVQLQLEITSADERKTSEENQKTEVSAPNTNGPPSGISLVLRQTSKEIPAEMVPSDVCEIVGETVLKRVGKAVSFDDIGHIDVVLEQYCSRRTPKESCREQMLDNAINIVAEAVRGCVGVIMSDGNIVGNCFRIGDKLVMTACHVVNDVENRAVPIVFPDVNQEYISRVVYLNKEIDVAVLELDVGDRSCKGLDHVSDCYPGYPFYMVGYPNTRLHKKIKRSIFASTDYTTDMSSQDMVLFESEKFGHGSSGSPGLAIVNGKVYVLTMLLGTFATETEVWYYGANMSDLYKLLKANRPDIAKQMMCHLHENIFKKTMQALKGGGDIRFRETEV